MFSKNLRDDDGYWIILSASKEINFFQYPIMIKSDYISIFVLRIFKKIKWKKKRLFKTKWKKKKLRSDVGEFPLIFVEISIHQWDLDEEDSVRDLPRMQFSIQLEEIARDITDQRFGHVLHGDSNARRSSDQIFLLVLAILLLYSWSILVAWRKARWLTIFFHMIGSRATSRVNEVRLSNWKIVATCSLKEHPGDRYETVFWCQLHPHFRKAFGKICSDKHGEERKLTFFTHIFLYLEIFVSWRRRYNRKQ